MSVRKKKAPPRQWPPQKPPTTIAETPYAKPQAPRPRPPPQPQRSRGAKPDAMQKNVTALMAAFQALNIQKRQIAVLRRQLKAAAINEHILRATVREAEETALTPSDPASPRIPQPPPVVAHTSASLSFVGPPADTAAPEWQRLEALALELDVLNWVLGEGQAYSRRSFWREALPTGVAMLRACDEDAELAGVVAAAWRPVLEASGTSSGGEAVAAQPPPALLASLRRARDRVNLRLMMSRACGAPSAHERLAWIHSLRAELPPLPLSLCLLSPAGANASLEPASGGGWKLMEPDAHGACGAARAPAVALVAPESRAVRVINDSAAQLNVRVLGVDGGLGRAAALLPGEVWCLLEAPGAVAGRAVHLLVSAATEPVGAAGVACAAGGGVCGWCAAVVRLERCDGTSQYGTICENEQGVSSSEWETDEWEEGEEDDLDDEPASHTGFDPDAVDVISDDDDDAAAASAAAADDDDDADADSRAAAIARAAAAREHTRVATILASPLSPLASPLNRAVLAFQVAADDDDLPAPKPTLPLARHLRGISLAARSTLARGLPRVEELSSSRAASKNATPTKPLYSAKREKPPKNLRREVTALHAANANAAAAAQESILAASTTSPGLQTTSHAALATPVASPSRTASASSPATHLSSEARGSTPRQPLSADRPTPRPSTDASEAAAAAVVGARAAFYEAFFALTTPLDTAAAATPANAALPSVEAGTRLATLRERAAAVQVASLGQSGLSDRWMHATTSALSALQRLPPPRRVGAVAEREALLSSITAQLQRASTGGVVAAALEARGIAILAETADAIVRAEPLYRPRELRRLGAPAFVAVVDTLAAASSAGGSGGRSPMNEAAKRLERSREALGSLPRSVWLPKGSAPEMDADMGCMQPAASNAPNDGGAKGGGTGDGGVGNGDMGGGGTGMSASMSLDAMFEEVEEAELPHLGEPSKRFTPPPPTAAYDSDSAPVAARRAAAAANSHLPAGGAADSPTPADSPPAAADAAEHTDEPQTAAEIDEVIALEHERLVRERERLHRRRLSRVSAPASSATADALRQLQQRDAQREPPAETPPPASVVGVAGVGALPKRRPSGGGLLARVGAPASDYGESARATKLPAIPASPAAPSAPQKAPPPPSPD